jgi:hypothetical protein
MPWGFAIAAVATVGSAYIQSESAEDAAAQQQEGADAGVNEQRRQFDLTRADYAPYREAGATALTQLQGDINDAPTADEVMAQPGYQFGLQQGQQALDRKTAAGGGRISGAALKSAAEYATNYATTGYNAEYQRRQDRLNRLAAIAGIGQTATAGSAAAGTNSANAISGILQNQGNAAGANQIAQGNIWANAGNQLGAIGSNYLQNRNSNQQSYNSGGYAGYQNSNYSSTDPNAAWTP